MARRLAVAALISLGLFIAVFGVWSIRDALSIRADLTAARRALEGVRGATNNLDVDEIERAIAFAQFPVEAAVTRSHSFGLRVVGHIPLLGRSARAVISLANAASNAVDAGHLELEAIDQFPQTKGKVDYSISGSRIDLTPWSHAAPILQSAQAALRLARDENSSTPRTWTIPAVSAQK